MNKALYVSFCLLLNCFRVSGQNYTSVIQTASGPIRGIISTTIEDFDYAAFKGIPYAKPPVGNLRFKPPVEIDSWDDVYNAFTESSVCTQFFKYLDSPQGSEDCLYINVYTPHTIFNESISKAVMVWIYGGGFLIGFANKTKYGPDFLLKEDVIIVTFNYRLSALGFLNLEHENATGNAGLKDQNLALKWVKKNIAQFGGNPDNVTIFGQSAGATSVDLHVLSDMSVGLFSQSISMSGSPFCLGFGFQTVAHAVKNGFLLGSVLGTNTSNKDTLLETLYNASADEIAIAASTIDFVNELLFVQECLINLSEIWNYQLNAFQQLPFRPTIENPNVALDQEKFLTECPLTKYMNGNYTKAPHMMGWMAKESAAEVKYLGGFFTVVQKTLEALMNSTSSTFLLPSDLINEMTGGEFNLEGRVTDKLIQETSDFFFIHGVDTKQRYISLHNDYPIYYYRFSFEPPDNLLARKFGGAGHGDDMPYILYTTLLKLPLHRTDIATARQRMVKLWTNFAKYGNPTPHGDDDKVLGITWPDSRPDGTCLDIGTNLTIIPRPTSHLVRILQLIGIVGTPIFNDCAKN